MNTTTLWEPGRRLVPLLVLCGLALPGMSANELDEVAVNGKTWRQLKREVIEAEDRFFKRFNALNTNDDFDIYCRMDKATGTIIPQRQCRIQFLVNAGAIDAQDFYMGLTTPAASRGVNTPLATLQPLWLQRREEYRQTARAVLEKNPELLAMANELARLREQYDRTRTNSRTPSRDSGR
ncbi:MAG: hypothetical protein ABIP83_11360 [Steroidobacteraceae bacterium]